MSEEKNIISSMFFKYAYDEMLGLNVSIKNNANNIAIKYAESIIQKLQKCIESLKEEAQPAQINVGVDTATKPPIDIAYFQKKRSEWHSCLLNSQCGDIIVSYSERNKNLYGVIIKDPNYIKEDGVLYRGLGNEGSKMLYTNIYQLIRYNKKGEFSIIKQDKMGTTNVEYAKEARKRIKNVYKSFTKFFDVNYGYRSYRGS